MELYNQVRPQKWEEVVGNKDTIQALKNEFEKEHPAQVFLFHGDSGCGKSTVARIACNVLDISDLDLEVKNIADLRGIDAARDIINRCKFVPFGGNKRAFIIEEIHKATNEWQNAMLETLEHAPENTYFFLCTTEPNKLLKAVRTRCSEYKFQSLKPKDIMTVLKQGAEEAEITVDPEILSEISNNSEGSPRTALKLLAKVQDIEDVDTAIDLILEGAEEATPDIRALCQALLKGEGWSIVKKILKSLKTEDPEKIRRAVLGYMSAVLLNSKNGKAAIILEEFAEPFWNEGFPGVVRASYTVIFS